METSSGLSVQLLQQAWLRSQARRPNPPSPGFSSLFDSVSPQGSSSGSPTSSLSSSNSDFSSSSSSNSSSQYGGGTVSPFEEDVLMDPVLDYINDMLMDEHTESQACMAHDSLRYKAIVNGFYDILGSESNLASLNNGWCSSGEDQSPRSDGDIEYHPGHHEEKNMSNLTGEEYSWIEQVLVSGLRSTPSQAESASESAPSLQLAASDQYALPLQKDVKYVLPATPSNVQLLFSSFPYGELAGDLAVPLREGLYPAFHVAGNGYYPGALPRNGLYYAGNGYDASRLPTNGLYCADATKDLARLSGSDAQTLHPGSTLRANGISSGYGGMSSLNSNVHTNGKIEVNGNTQVPSSTGNGIMQVPSSNGNSGLPSSDGSLQVPSSDDEVRLLDGTVAPLEAPRYPWQDPVGRTGTSIAGLRSVSPPREFQLASLAQDMQQFVTSEYARFLVGAAASHEVVKKYRHAVESVNGGGSGGTREEGYVLSFVMNENLRAEEDAKLYGEWETPGELEVSAKKARKGRPKGGTCCGDLAASAVELYSVDLHGLLVSCAQAVAGMEVRKAQDLLAKIRRYASPRGDGVQRLAHYFSEALAGRLAGTGARLYAAMSKNRPSAARMLKAFNVAFQVCPYNKIAHYFSNHSILPYTKVAHYFANHSILRAAEGAARLHIVDYGIVYGIQWPSLISALAERKGGPPFLHITGIEFPQPGADPAAVVEDTGQRLAEYARTYHVPFEYTAVAKGWEEVWAADMRIAQGEVLVVNCINRLRHLLDESVMADCPRSKVLANIRALEPDLFVTSVISAGFNSPFFVSRFREALNFYSGKFDMVDTLVEPDNPERLMMEEHTMGRAILNVVACEGLERVERYETYKQWQGRIQRAGFEQTGLDPAVLSRCRALLKSFYHKDFGVHDDDNRWMLLGWKGRIVEALCTWKPAHP